MLPFRRELFAGAKTVLLWKNREMCPTSGEPFWIMVDLFFPQTWLWRKKRLSSTKESRFSKLLSKRAILALFFFSVYIVVGSFTGLRVQRMYTHTGTSIREYSQWTDFQSAMSTRANNLFYSWLTPVTRILDKARHAGPLSESLTTDHLFQPKQTGRHTHTEKDRDRRPVILGWPRANSSRQ